MRDIDQLAELASANADAKDWYAEAGHEISTICQLEDWRPDIFIGILAATSPRVAVRRNIRITLQYIGTGEFLSNVIRSIKTSVRTFNETGELLGPKTSAFAAALRGDVDAVVLDTHMAALFNVQQSLAFRRKPEIAHWTHVVRTVGSRIGMTGREAQACLWYGHKRNVGENPEKFPIVLEYRNWVKHNRRFPRDGAIASDFDRPGNSFEKVSNYADQF